LESETKILAGPRPTAVVVGMMEELAGDAHISFEGDFRGFRVLSTPGASQEEPPALKRNTRSPKLGFVVPPLEPSMSRRIARISEDSETYTELPSRP
jgi:hypothetical protein